MDLIPNITLSDLAELSKILLTPLVAMIAVYIAWKQWQLNHKKLLWDQYERRLRVYENTNKIIYIVIRDAHASYDELLKFRISVSEADFLFGNEIIEHIDKIYKHGVDLQNFTLQYRDNSQVKPDGYDHQVVCDGMHSELEYFNQQVTQNKQKFKKYLSVGL